MAARALRRFSRGYSLIEMLVAVAILGLALGALYQSASGATRNVRTDERYAYAVELARSLVADNSVVPNTGLVESGETASGFIWNAVATPLTRPRASVVSDGRMQRLVVTVSWPDGPRVREVTMHTIVAGSVL
jgi:general secretion pathway protein I